MTAKRFTLKHFESQDWAYDNNKPIHTKEMVDLLNELHEENEYLCEKIKENEWHWNTIDEDRDVWIYNCKTLEEENEQLKRELQRMYDVATLNKAIEVLENKYDKMLSEGSDEVKDAMRHTVLRCIEDLDELKDDITAR